MKGSLRLASALLLLAAAPLPAAEATPPTVAILHVFEYRQDIGLDGDFPVRTTLVVEVENVAAVELRFEGRLRASEAGPSLYRVGLGMVQPGEVARFVVQGYAHPLPRYCLDVTGYDEWGFAAGAGDQACADVEVTVR